MKLPVKFWRFNPGKARAADRPSNNLIIVWETPASAEILRDSGGLFLARRAARMVYWTCPAGIRPAERNRGPIHPYTEVCMKARNPILPLQYYCPDGEPHLVNGELFVYPSFDVSAGSYCSNRLFVAHSRDLAEWKVDGPVFDTAGLDWEPALCYPPGLDDAGCYEELPGYLRDTIPEETKRLVPFHVFRSNLKQKIREHRETDRTKRLLYAPDALTVDGRSSLFFCTSDGLEGVAFSDRPEGPYKAPVMITADRSGKPIQGIDPGVFRDDDGKVYLYWGQINSFGAELTEDLARVKEDTIVKNLLTEKEHGFHEGSSMRKIGGTYYYIFTDTHRGKATSLGYATAKSPLGPFVYRGIIVDNDGCDPETWNNHGSIECVGGQWYVFYHRSTGNSRFLRRMCAEPIFFDENGAIREVPVTSIGMGEPYKAGEPLYGYQACQVRNAYVDRDALVVQPGEAEAVYRYIGKDVSCTRVDFDGDGEAALSFRVDGQGELRIRLRAEAPVRIRSFFLK